MRLAMVAFEQDTREVLKGARGELDRRRRQTLEAREAPEADDVGLGLKVSGELVDVIWDLGVVERADVDEKLLVDHDEDAVLKVLRMV